MHAYELQILPEQEQEAFEKHLLNCGYCYEQLSEMQEDIEILRTDSDVLTLPKRDNHKPLSWLQQISAYLWPNVPIVFKPAILWLLIFTMISTSFIGIDFITNDSIREVQSIALTPTRSFGNSYEITNDQDIVISFLFQKAESGQTYQVTIRSGDGDVIYSNSSYDGFDNYNTGRLILPSKNIISGNYVLQISDKYNQPDTNQQIYNFMMKRTPK